MPRNCRRSKAAAVQLYDATVERSQKILRFEPWLSAAEDCHRASVG
jgi:hypothetical protein